MTLDLDVSRLATEAGATEAGVRIAVHVAKEILHPVWDHMPPQMRAVFFERLLSGMAGAACSELGPDRTKLAFDAVKLAIDDAALRRANAH